MNLAPGQKGRYAVLMDRTYDMNLEQNQRLDKYFLKRSMKVENTLASDVGNIADIQTGAIYMCAASVGGSQNSTVGFNIRVRFTDA